jgi:DNA-binding transcriptional regulator YdaS (Cro superfamily)
MVQALRKSLQARNLRLADLARSLKVDKATVTRWDQKRVPAERAEDVKRATGIPLHELRPDLWEAPADEVAA